MMLLAVRPYRTNDDAISADAGRGGQRINRRGASIDGMAYPTHG